MQSSSPIGMAATPDRQDVFTLICLGVNGNVRRAEALCPCSICLYRFCPSFQSFSCHDSPPWWLLGMSAEIWGPQHLKISRLERLHVPDDYIQEVHRVEGRCQKKSRWQQQLWELIPGLFYMQCIYGTCKKGAGLHKVIAAILIFFFFYFSMNAPDYILSHLPPHTHTPLVTFLTLSHLTRTYTHNAQCSDIKHMTATYNGSMQM